MNDRQLKFIEMLEKHLAQEVSLKQMRTWLTENIKPIVYQSKAYLKPGMWLEMYAYREIHWYIEDIEDPTISRKSNLDWYWEEAKRVLDLLLGHKIYKQTEYRLEFPLDDKKRKSDQWMLPYLGYGEKVLQILTTTQTHEITKSNLPKLDLVFEPPPPTIRTCSEFIMDEMLNTINEYEDTERYLTDHPPDLYYSPELKSVQLHHLEKLIKCFKGELCYSVSVIFEGLEKFSITIVI